MIEGLNRRSVLKGGAAAAALATLPVYGRVIEAVAAEKVIVSEPAEWAGIEPGPEHERIGEYVKVEDIMLPKLPTPEPVKMLGSDTGLIISKRFHRFWLFKAGELLQEGPVGSARTDKGQDTPEGLFKLTRKEGANYSSGEFPARDPNEPNMSHASFFHKRGIAFHGSLNFIVKHRSDGDVEYLRLDNSHGCTNARKVDAELVHKELKIGDSVAVLP